MYICTVHTSKYVQHDHGSLINLYPRILDSVSIREIINEAMQFFLSFSFLLVAKVQLFKVENAPICIIGDGLI